MSELCRIAIPVPDDSGTAGLKTFVIHGRFDEVLEKLWPTATAGFTSQLEARASRTFELEDGGLLYVNTAPVWLESWPRED